MKKYLFLEVILLTVLLIASVILVAQIPALAPDTKEPTKNQGQTTDPTTQTSDTDTDKDSEPTWATFPANRVITAQQYFVYDCQKGAFVQLQGNTTDRVYPASITKLFTAYVALQYLQEETQITAGDALDLVGPGSSVAEIEKGDVLSAGKLVEAMLLPSGNDAAYILAVEVGRLLAKNDNLPASQAAAAFVDLMNQQAKSLGMTGTHFVNPDGYHEEAHYTNYQDLVTMAKLAMENPVIRGYATTSREQVTLAPDRQKQWKNTNALIDPESQYYCPYAIGLKTGQTPSAGSCLLSAFQTKEGEKYIVGVFGCPDVEDRFADTLQLFNKTLGLSES